MHTVFCVSVPRVHAYTFIYTCSRVPTVLASVHGESSREMPMQSLGGCQRRGRSILPAPSAQLGCRLSHLISPPYHSIPTSTPVSERHTSPSSSWKSRCDSVPNLLVTWTGALVDAPLGNTSFSLPPLHSHNVISVVLRHAITFSYSQLIFRVC